MPWQPADQGTIAKDEQGVFHVKVGDNWMPAPSGSVAKDAQGAYHVNSDALAPAPPPDPIGAANQAASESEHGPVQEIVNSLKAIPHGAVKMLQGIGQNAFDHPILGNIPALLDTIKRVASDPSGTLTSVGNALRNATGTQVGENVLGPLALSGVVGAGAGLASGVRAAAAETAATPAGQLGLRTATGPGATMAGNTAGTTMDIQNQRVASTVLGADAGVPHTSPVTAASLKTARAAPGQLLDQGYGLIPPSNSLSPAARSQVLAARGPATITPPTPNVANRIDAIEQSLVNPTKPIDGPSLRATRNSLSSDAEAGADSDDADTRAIAKYQRNVVNALDQHVADSLPTGSAVTPDQVANARSTLAKNYQLQDLIGKGGDIDLQALAKLHRDAPELLTGNTRTVAQFAHEHPEVTGGISDATRISPPSLLNDISHVNLLQRPLGSVGQALFGAAGRRLLRGPNGEAIGQAMQAPVAGLGGEFSAAPSAEGISSAPIEQPLGDIISGQRGAIGPPTDIGGLRHLMNNPRTYTGMKPDEMAALEDALKKLEQQPRTYTGTSLGQEF